MNTNYDAMCKRVARTLVREYKEEKGNTIPILDSFTWVTSGEKSEVCFIRGEKRTRFGYLGDEGVAQLTRDVASHVERMLKLPKRTLILKDEEKKIRWRQWSDYNYFVVRKFVIVNPCKQFAVINRKLVKLGCKPIPFAEWYHGDVAGKRDSIFSVDKEYYAADERKCEEVLAYLKGKKKVSCEIVRVEDFEDRARGIMCETEWYGHLYYRLKFTDFKGHATTI